MRTVDGPPMFIMTTAVGLHVSRCRRMRLKAWTDAFEVVCAGTSRTVARPLLPGAVDVEAGVARDTSFKVLARDISGVCIDKERW